MVWIDYKKVYDTVPQIWIVDSLKMSKISDKVVNFITQAMKDWKVELISCQKIFSKEASSREMRFCRYYL